MRFNNGSDKVYNKEVKLVKKMGELGVGPGLANPMLAMKGNRRDGTSWRTSGRKGTRLP